MGVTNAVIAEVARITLLIATAAVIRIALDIRLAPVFNLFIAVDEILFASADRTNAVLARILLNTRIIARMVTSSAVIRILLKIGAHRLFVCTAVIFVRKTLVIAGSQLASKLNRIFFRFTITVTPATVIDIFQSVDAYIGSHNLA